MKKVYLIILTSFILLWSLNSFSQISLITTGTPYSQNFDGMGTSATATLPTGFKIGLDWATGTTATTLAYGTNGAGIVTGTSPGGIINWANGITASATDRSLGFLTTGGFASPNSIVLRITNNTGVVIGSFDVSFDYEKYRSGSRQFDWTFDHGSTSSLLTSLAAGDQSYPADATNTVINNPPTAITKTFSITGLSLANGASYYLRWTSTGLAGSTNGQGLGIDNFSITAQPATPTFTSTGAGGNWTTGTTWVGGIVPTAGSTANIVGPVAINGTTGQISNTGIININTNGTLSCAISGALIGAGVVNVNGTGVLAIDQDGWPGNTNSFVYATTSTLRFNNTLGSYGVNGGDPWWPASSGPQNVNVSGAGGITMSVARTVGSLFQTSGPVTLSSVALTLSGINQLNSGGSFNQIPTYTNTSTLVYNTSYGVFNEWTGNSTTAGVGIPQNVTIQNSSVVTMPNSNRGMAGNLSINSGSLVLNATSGDLYIAGSWTRASAATFTPNNRAVFFNGSGTQTVSVTGGGTEIFNYLLVQGSGTLQLNSSTATDITVTANSGLSLSSSNATSTIDLNGRTLALTGGGSLNINAGNRFVTSSTGTGIFSTGGSTLTVTNGGTLAFSTATLISLANGMDFGALSLTTVNGTLRINTNGFVTGNSPRYGTSSTLLYNSGTNNYQRQLEWTSSTAAIGTPANVQISNNTFLFYYNGGNTGIQNATGNLTVDAGAALYMENNGVAASTLGSLVVTGNVSNSGTLKLGFASGDDIKLSGNLTLNGAGFNPNSRAVFFLGGNNQSIGGTGTPYRFDYVVLNKTAGVVSIAGNTTIEGVAAGQPMLTLTANTDYLSIGSNTLILGKTGLNSLISGTGYIRGSSASNLTILGDGSFGTIRFDPTTPGTTNLLLNFVQNRTSSGTITLGNDVNVSGIYTLTNGLFVIGSNYITLAAAATIGGTPSVNNMVVADGAGELRKTFASTGSFTFPIGDASAPDGNQYSPVTVSLTAGTGYSSTSFIGMRVTDLVHPSMPILPANYITRYWTVRTFNITNPVYDVIGTYTPADIVGTEALANSGWWNGTVWSEGQALASNQATITGLTAVGPIPFSGGSFPLISNQYFRSVVNNGAWATPASWETSPTGGAPWSIATVAPAANAASILIRNTFNIISSGTVTADDITIEAGATLTVSAGTFTLNNGTGTDMIVNGTFTVSGGSFVNNAGATSSYSGAAIYNHAINGGTIPTGTWNNTSTCNITGMTTTAPAGLGQSFGIFTWNCNQTASINYCNINNAAFGVTNTLNVLNTGNSDLALVGATTTSYTNTVNNLNVNGGTFFINYYTSSTGGIGTLNVTGNATVSDTTSSIFDFVGGSGNPAAFTYVAILNLTGDLTVGTLSSFTLSNRQSNPYGRLNFNGTAAQNINVGAGSGLQRGYIDYFVNAAATVQLSANLGLAYNDYFTVNGTLITQNFVLNVVAGSSTEFFLNPASTIITSVNAGVNSTGAIQTDFRTFSSTANYEFRGTNTGTFTTTPTAATVNNLTINRGAGVNLSTSLRVNGALNLSLGVLTVPTSTTLTIAGTVPAPVGTIDATGASSTVALANTGFTLNPALFSPAAGTLSNLINQPLSGTNTLNGNFTIDRTLTLTSGILNNGNNTLTLQTGGSVQPIVRTAGTLTVGTGSTLIFGPAGAGGVIPNGTFTSAPVITNFTLNRSQILTLGTQGMQITGTLTLSNGTLNIGPATLLDLNGASLIRTAGFLSGDAISGSTSDFTVRGTNASVVNIWQSGNIGLRNITLGGNRIVAQDGTNNISLSGNLVIPSGTTWDNGGESNLTASGSPAINITGTFITRDMDGFTGSNTSIPSISPTLNAGCSIHYGRVTGNQLISIRSDYKNLLFTGNGTKTHAVANSITPIVGTVSITDANTIVDVSNNTFGDGSTNFTMTAGRFRTAGTGTKPDMSGPLYMLTGGFVEFTNNAVATAQAIRNESYLNVEVSGSNVSNSNGNITLKSDGSFTVKGTGVFTINSNSIIGPSGTQTVTIEDGGIFRCGNNEGFHGFPSTLTNYSSLHQNIENVQLLSGSTVEYTRAIPAQSTDGQPITNTVPYHHLNISGTGIKTAPTGTLEVKGDLVKSGTSTFAPNNGKVFLNGTNQNFAGLPFSQIEMTGGIKTTIGSPTIDSTLKLNGSTNLNIRNGDSITILSTANRTASVMLIPASASITYNTTGKFSIQRYLLNARKWRLLSVPTINGTQTIRNSWLENGANNTGFGFRALDVRSDWAARGFDGLGTNTSVKKFNTTTELWDPVDNVTPLNTNDQRGYIAFVPGDRSVTFGSSGATTLRTSGQLYTGTQSLINVPAGKFAIIGNPYPSRIDIRNFVFTGGPGIEQNIYVWDPSLTSYYGFGAFNSLYLDGGVYKNLLPSPLYGGSGSPHNEIESGAAFFVKATGVSTVTIGESAKALGSAVLMFSPLEKQDIRVNLYLASSISTPILLDGVMANFDSSYTNGIDGYDINKMKTFAESVSWKTSDSTLVIDRRFAIQNNDTLRLSIGNMRMQNYQWAIIGNNLDLPGRKGFLIDKFTNTSTQLDMAGTTNINFSVQNAAGSSATDRFYIVFTQPDFGPVPVSITSVTASRQADQTIAVQWKTENEINISGYELQRSDNGAQFGDLAAKAATANNGGRAVYNHIDNQPLAGDNFYRIKATSIGGQVQFSSIVKVAAKKQGAFISIYPNPVAADGLVQLRFGNQAPGNYRLQLSNAAGQILYNSTVNVAAAVQAESLQLPTRMAAGNYQLRIWNPAGTEQVLQVLVQ